jgi:CubicO group peptidase (beta-lactamase class C family)
VVRRAGLVAIALAVSTSLRLGLVADARSQDATTAVDDVAVRWMRTQHLPSLSVAIARGDRLLVAKAYGFADLEHETVASDRSIYRVGSITKQFSAAAILKLVEQQRLSLDDRLNRFVPALPAAAGNVTIRQLLNHTSGIRSMTSIPAFAAKERLDLSDDEMLDVFKREPLEFESGSNFLYNNSAYYLIAMVIEKVSGRPYAEHMRDEVFLPMGLTDTSACDDRKLLANRARGYTFNGTVLENAPFISMAPPKGGGNICSTARDLAAWAHGLAAGRVVSAASYKQMIEPGKLRDSRSTAYGYGLFLSALDDRLEISHGGGIVGFTAYLGSFPNDELIVVTLTNSDSARLYDGHLGRELARAVMGRPDPVPREPTTDVSTLERVVGTYRTGAATLTVQRNGNGLRLSGEHSVEQLWEHDFVLRGDYQFEATANGEYRLAFAPMTSGMRLSMTLSGRAIGDFVRSK